MSKFQNKLARVKNLIAEKDSSKKIKHPQRYTKMANRLKGEIVSNFAGSYCLVKTLYDSSYIHGDVSLSNITKNEKIPLSPFTPRDDSSYVNRLSLCFFDTERDRIVY